MLQAEILGHFASEEWDRFVRLSPQGSIFATTAYLDALAASYDLVVARKDGIIDVGIPLVRNALGFHTNPLFCKYLGVLTGSDLSSKEPLTASRLYERIDALGPAPFNNLTFDYLFHPRFDNWMPFYWRGFSQQTQYTFRIYPGERDTWWEGAETRLATPSEPDYATELPHSVQWKFRLRLSVGPISFAVAYISAAAPGHRCH